MKTALDALQPIEAKARGKEVVNNYSGCGIAKTKEAAPIGAASICQLMNQKYYCFTKNTSQAQRPT
jgi:hypothetical protein